MINLKTTGFALICTGLLVACDPNLKPNTTPPPPVTVAPPPPVSPPPPPPPPPPPDRATNPQVMASVSLPDYMRPRRLPRVAKSVTRNGQTRTIMVDRIVPFSWDKLPEGQRLPMFKAPKTPLKHNIPRSDLVKDEAKPPSLYQVHNRIVKSISSKGAGTDYETATLGFKGGFAILTQVERIDAKGKTLRSPDGYRINMTEHPVNGLNDYVQLLLTTPRRSARAFAFIVSTDAQVVALDAPLPSQTMIAEQITRGAATLPAALSNFPYSKDYTCTLLIYEYDNYEGEDGKIISADGTLGLSKKQHLDSSGILKGLAQ